MKEKEPAKTFWMMIYVELKKTPFFTMVYTEIIQRFMGESYGGL